MNLSSGMSADKSADASADVLGRISYMILVQVVPLVANNGIIAISHPF